MDARSRLRCVGLVALGVAVAGAALARSKGSDAASTRILCGVERWNVKTLQDRPNLLPLQKTTVAHLVAVKPPRYLPISRLPFERHVFQVTAAVTLVRSEADDDLHLVLESGNSQMIAEAPSPRCTGRAFQARRSQMTIARRKIRVCARARVTGVVFFDFKHGQTGVAPNGIELHPVLAFRCLTRPD
jgi:hypothetical protein